MDGPTAGVFQGREHLLPVRVYYEDTDFTGLVYHASYLRFFERGRTDALRLVGVGHTDLLSREDPCAFAVIRIVVDFKSAARIDDALTVHTWFEAINGPRLMIRQQITREGSAVATAEVEAACIRPGGGARRPPVDMREKLTPYLATERT
jgi:acyl-CoA thioester hydrolase